MASPRRRPVLLLPLLVLSLALVCFWTPAKAAEEEIGPEGMPRITLMVPLTPLLVDQHQALLPPVRRWLAYVAEQSGIGFRMQPGSFDRRLAETTRYPNSCILGMARLPEREKLTNWLSVIRRDRVIFIARGDDPFTGSMANLLREADNQIAAPSGIYRPILDRQGVRYYPIDDQRALARMVALGRIRFGIVLAGTLEAADIQPLGLRAVAEMEPLEYWFTCSRELPPSLSLRLAAVLRGKDAEALRRVALGEAVQPPPNAALNNDEPPTQ